MNLQTASPNMDRVSILGMPIDRVDLAETLEILEGFVKSGAPHTVVTADASGIVQSRSDAEFREIFAAADLVTPDSIGVIWAAKRRGRPIRERVSGVELLDRICRLSADRGYRLFFLGSAPGVADLAAEKLRLRHPGCNIVGTHHGFFPADSDDVVAQEIAEARPDFLFVAMGIPRQEKFIAATRHIIGAPVAMGIGGSLDVFSGKTRRAPKLLQRVHLEWMWRLLLNPSKIAKVKYLPKFVYLVLRAGR